MKDTVANAFDAAGDFTANVIEAVKFSDSSLWDQAKLKQLITAASPTLQGTAGSDTLIGGDGDDIFIGAKGNDQLAGGKGNDIYQYALGDGNDVITDVEGIDRIELGAGIAKAQVSVKRDASNNLVFTFVDGGAISVANAFDTSGNFTANAVEAVRFADSSSWDQARIKQLLVAPDQTLAGTTGIDDLIGDAGNDTFTGGKGSDNLSGGAGDDTYIFNRGDGADKISDIAGSDTIQFGLGITPEDVIVVRNEKNLYFLLKNGEMLEALGNANGTSYDSAYAIEKVIFSNGDVWDAQTIEQKIAATLADSNILIGRVGWDEIYRSGASSSYYINGLEGDDDIVGGDGNDTIVGGGGLNFLDGRAGGDTYLITEESGYRGNAFLASKDGGNFITSFRDANDRILFAEGITPQDVSVRIIPGRSESSLQDGVLYKYSISHADDEWSLELKTNIATVYLVDIFKGDTRHGYGASLLNPNLPVGTVEFFNGTKWTFDDLLNQAVQASENNDVIFGAASSTLINGLGGNDFISAPGTSAQTLIGGTGNDSLVGGSGNDVYRGDTGNDQLTDISGNDIYQFNLGDGTDVIWDSSGKDIISFGTGITKEQTILTPNGENLEVSFGNSTDKIIIYKGALAEAQFYQGGRIEYFNFANGDVWNFDEKTKPQLKEGDSFSNELKGGDGNDTLIGHAGNDYLYGGIGDDTYLFDIGDGSDVIQDNDGANTLLLGPYITPQQTRINWTSNAGLRLSFDLSNEITFYGASGVDGELNPSSYIDTVRFSNNEVWNFNRILSESYKGTSANEYFYGFSSADSINGGAGNDEIYTYSGDDTLLGGAGDDYLRGGLGNDTYQFNLSDGTDFIYDEGGVDTLEFLAGILPSDVTFSRTERDLIIKVKNANPITVGDIFSGSGSDRGVNAISAVESILFANATRWTMEDILNKIPLVGTSSANTLYGFSSNDLLDGLGGNDSIYSGGGNDTLIGGTGNDWLSGELGGDWLQGGDGNDVLYDIDGANIYQGGKGDDDIITGANSVLRFGIGDGVDLIQGGVEIVEFDQGITASMLFIKSYAKDAFSGEYYTDRFDLGIKGTTSLIKGLYVHDQMSIKFSDANVWNADTIRAEYNKTRAMLSLDRTFITGNTTPGALVSISYRNQDNSLINYPEIVADSLGSYRLDFGFPIRSASRISISSKDAYSTVLPIIAIEPPIDLTTPPAPTAEFDETGYIISGIAKPGADIYIRATGIYGTTAQADILTGAYTIKLNNLPVQDQLIDVVAYMSGNPVASAPKTIQYSSAVSLPGSGSTPLQVPSANFDSSGASVSGITTPGALVYVTVPILGSSNSKVIGHTRASIADGSYTVTLSETVIDGSSVAVIVAGAKGAWEVGANINSPDLTRPLPAIAAFNTAGKIISGSTLLEYDAGILVTVRDSTNTVVLGSKVMGSNEGAFNITLTTALTNNEAVNITVTDIAGNTSYVTTIRAPDKTAPALPTAAFDTAGKVITGVAEAGSTVVVKNSGNTTTLGTVTADATTGAYSVTLVTALINKETVNVTAKDAAGNVSAVKAIVAPDKTAPALPTAAFDTAGKVITGVAEAGSTVEVKNSGNTATLGTATANATTGAYTITLTTALINKETVNVTAKDVAGNVSAVKTIIAPDKTAPALPTAAFDTAGKVITGVAEAGSTVVVKNSGNTTTLGTVTADATTGAYSVTLVTALINKETVNVTAKDAAGNVSAVKAIVAPDKTAPALPTAAFDTAGKVITGVAEAGSTVEVKNSGNTATLGTATANATTGAYTITLTTALINKETVNVTAKDVAGNVSAVKAIIAPDKTAPALPTAAFDTAGKVITGVAEAGSTVEVKNSGNTATLGTATANATTGAYTITLTTALINKETVNVTAKDTAGNVSAVKAIIAPDKTAPSLPTAAFDTAGKVITGVAEAGSTVEVKNSGNTTILGTATANATTGAYTITLTTALINKETVNVTAKDTAGNVSAVKAIIAPDKTAPGLPTAAFDTAGKVITGVAEAGSTVVVKNSGNTTTLGTVTANVTTGAYSVTLATALINKETVNITAKDAAGNVSAVKAIIAPDKTAPALPTGAFNTAGKIITGVAEAGSTVVVKNSGNTTTLGTVTANATNGSYSVTLATALTKGETVNITAKDAAGNVSAAKAIVAPNIAAPLASQSFMSQKSVDATLQLDSMIQAMAAFAPPSAAESKVLVGVYDMTQPILASQA